MNLAEACNVTLDSDVKIVDRMDDWKQVLSRDPFKSLISTLKRKYRKRYP